MYRLSLLTLSASLLFAQSSAEPKPPAKVDQALRARINEFYQDHVKQEFRKAEALVANDTKEYFYSHNKPAYLSCEIGKIAYSDNFKKAKATVICEQYVMMPGFADKPLKVPFASTWKVQGGKWFWYVSQDDLAATPFGHMTAGPKGSGGGLPAVIPDSPDFVMSLVRADRGEITLKPDGEPEKVTIKNGAPGVVDLSIAVKVPGVEATIEQPRLKVGEQTVLTLKASESARPGTLGVQVDPTGQVLNIKILIH